MGIGSRGMYNQTLSQLETRDASGSENSVPAYEIFHPSND